MLPPGGTDILPARARRPRRLAAALADVARSGGGRLVVIEGTAGIGKTRLLGEVRAIAGSVGMQVLAARGGELEGEFAYGIVRQLFEPLLATASSDAREELRYCRRVALTSPGCMWRQHARTRSTDFVLLSGSGQGHDLKP
jgi:hypothetical protein